MSRLAAARGLYWVCGADVKAAAVGATLVQGLGATGICRGSAAVGLWQDDGYAGEGCGSVRATLVGRTPLGGEDVPCSLVTDYY